MNRTLEEVIARQLAVWDGYEWQAHPNAAQSRKQTEYERRARCLIGIVVANGAP